MFLTTDYTDGRGWPGPDRAERMRRIGPALRSLGEGGRSTLQVPSGSTIVESESDNLALIRPFLRQSSQIACQRCLIDGQHRHFVRRPGRSRLQPCFRTSHSAGSHRQPRRSTDCRRELRQNHPKPAQDSRRTSCRCAARCDSWVLLWLIRIGIHRDRRGCGEVGGGLGGVFTHGKQKKGRHATASVNSIAARCFSRAHDLPSGRAFSDRAAATGRLGGTTFGGSHSSASAFLCHIGILCG